MKVEKLARQMEAWRFGHDVLPIAVSKWTVPLTNGFTALVSPRAGNAHGAGSKVGTVIQSGWWIIRAETGCLYAVSDTEFWKKYRPLKDPTDEPPAASTPPVRICWPASAPRPDFIH
jgi:hypothetical protein